MRFAHDPKLAPDPSSGGYDPDGPADYRARAVRPSPKPCKSLDEWRQLAAKRVHPADEMRIPNLRGGTR